MIEFNIYIKNVKVTVDRKLGQSRVVGPSFFWGSCILGLGLVRVRLGLVLGLGLVFLVHLGLGLVVGLGLGFGLGSVPDLINKL